MPDFSKLQGLVPAIIQDNRTSRVLMLGFMNAEAYRLTKEKGLVTFYSRSRQKLWTKGEESGNYLRVVEIHEDCDRDTLLIRANPDGPVCHTGSYSCFSSDKGECLDFLLYLQEFLKKRREEMPEGSYTSRLFSEGINRIAQKVGEEAVELVIEAKDSDGDKFLDEAADLMYHMIVLLLEKGYSLQDVIRVLESRHR
jgi:phosphoribosyl-ATP pyrophosphohydrolase/phosphoribosyl-AMP cyclohydrolase